MRAMTGYGQARKKKRGEEADIIIKSLNSKYLDIEFHHLPPQKIALEVKLRKLIEKKIFRGRVEVYLFLKFFSREKAVFNFPLFYDYYRQLTRMAALLKIDGKLSIKDFLSLPGLVRMESSSKGEDNLIIEGEREALARLVEFREKEGKNIKKEILTYLKDLNEIIRKVKKIKPKIGEELGKEDIKEEITLITFYLRRMRRLVNEKSNLPKGKKIDFLAQEILRELNTCMSKTKKVRVASLIVKGKTCAERIREQAQNIE
ncbi:MAG: hypothetical protein DRP72_00985 [Candidatus Omnitrophota bacterium]|nr:MAG: hypothetical protein DRP72_00985 [Candidatus Omnitrophota bacterium]